MIIENAFYKIPEILMSYDNIDDGYEGNIVNLLMTAVVLEFNIRNVDTPLKLIRTEKRYHMNNRQRCDMYVDYRDTYDERILTKYNIQSKNYIEAKYYGGKKRHSGNEVKTQKVGEFIYDIYRLFNYTDSNDGKYLFAIFNDKPETYLAFKKQTNDGLKERNWLMDLLYEGIHNISFSLDDESRTIKKIFKNAANVNFNFIANTISIKPVLAKTKDAFWCYLIKIYSDTKLA